MKKNIYRAKNVKSVVVEKLAELVRGLSIVVGVDVAKKYFFACLMDERRQVHSIVKWEHPRQTREFVDLLLSLPVKELVVAMEPSGVYGDSLRHVLMEAEIEVYRVSAKRTHDAAEVYDGVPSSHDAKSSTVIARLHLDGGSRLWEAASERKLELRAAIDIMNIHDEEYHRNLNRLEAMLARHWPELTGFLDLDSATLLKLLKEIGGPAEVCAGPNSARKLMRKVGGNFLAFEKIECVIESAGRTLGVPLTGGESRKLRLLVKEIIRSRNEYRKARRQVERLSGEDLATRAIGDVVGIPTAAVLTTEVGEPSDFGSASAYQKAAGLNIKERSSGKHQGQKKITKRGSAMARRWLYMAVLRWIQSDEIARAWYNKKVVRDGGKKMKALVALMRKLIKALWHVGQGEQFDSTKLFNVSRLDFGAV
jgi:transposase